jgi:uncharacterized secreted protein with C-terminal beta-propeller domain
MNHPNIEEEIRKKAEEIPVPESLQPEQIEEKLKTVKQKKKFLVYGAGSGMKRKGKIAVAACLAVCLLAVGGMFWNLRSEPDSGEEVSEENISEEGTSEVKDASGEEGRTAERTGTSYETLYAAIDRYNSSGRDAEGGCYLNESAEYEETDDVSSSKASGIVSSDTAASGGDYSDTDTQVADIMEGDIVKTDGSHIFVVEERLGGSRIQIYQANGKKVKRLSKIDIAEQTALEMYLSGSRLVILSQSWSLSGANGETNLLIYDISDAAKPQKKAEHSQSGTYAASRLADGIVYVFTEHLVWSGNCQKSKPKTYVPRIDGEVIPEENIACLTDEDSNRYMVMTSLAVDSAENFVDTFCAFGGSDVYYMNDSSIYVTQKVYPDVDSGAVTDDIGNSLAETASQEVRTQITKFVYSAGTFSQKASAQVRGVISNSYYMHEYKGYFCFVYTRYLKDGESTKNGICIMDDTMNLVGELDGLGKNETIYSSYYIDNMAYFVTYRETDPVFAVDLSNPKKPKLKSKIKLPGFSSYLHSFGENQLLGIGEGEWEDGEGGAHSTLKFSLFEMNDQNQLSERSSSLLGKYLSSIAGNNHKAVFIDEERALVGLAVETRNGKTRYRLYHYKNGKWKCILNRKNLSAMENVRGLRIGNYFYVADTEEGIQGCVLP